MSPWGTLKVRGGWHLPESRKPPQARPGARPFPYHPEGTFISPDKARGVLSGVRFSGEPGVGFFERGDRFFRTVAVDDISPGADGGKGRTVNDLVEEVITAVGDCNVPPLVGRVGGAKGCGHAVLRGTTTWVHNLVPSGVESGALGHIGGEVLLSPDALIQEMQVHQADFPPLSAAALRRGEKVLSISPDARILLPADEIEGLLAEAARCTTMWSSTGSGIGAFRRAELGFTYDFESRDLDWIPRSEGPLPFLTMRDLLDPQASRTKLQIILAEKKATAQRLLGRVASPAERARFRPEEYELDHVLAQLDRWQNSLAQFIQRDRAGGLQGDPAFLRAMRDAGHPLIFETHQSEGLDLLLGRWKGNTKNRTGIHSVLSSTGLTPKEIEYVLFVSRFYGTYHGIHNFPTVQKGREFDPLRDPTYHVDTACDFAAGWADLPGMRFGVWAAGLERQGPQGLFLTNVDRMRGLPKIRFCTGYQVDCPEAILVSMAEAAGKQFALLSGDPARSNWYQQLLANAIDRRRSGPNTTFLKDWIPVAEFARPDICRPVYEAEVDGFNHDISGVSSFEDLPKGVQQGALFISEYLGVPLVGMSVGPSHVDSFPIRIR